MRHDLPAGTVTFLFTDVEGSTRLLRELGPEGYAKALAAHRTVVRDACGAHGGVEVDTQGDAFFFAFPTAPGALQAAAALTERLASGPIRVRVGLHTGTPLLADEGYVGVDVHRAARIAAAGHGGQVLVSAATAPLVEGELRDLGDHRFKDLSAPERVYQLGSARFPPLKTLHQTNLPVPQTPFLGRRSELDEVRSLLARDDVRLLTLTGPGGTGKTRLATQAAGSLADRYRHGVFWVPLAALRDPALVLESAAQALGATDGVAAHIADKRLLLLFDNFEHVLAAAGEISSLLDACPRLDVLVTSREPLHLAGEQEYPVPPLADGDAVGFFATRARAVKPDFELDDTVAEICRRLDWLPLALELAAARAKALSSEQILARLDRRLPLLTGGRRDAPERQRTLRAAIEWSYELLTPAERRLLRRLSVFAGGCTIEAAEDVCAADLDTLQSLVDKSLVRFSGERYWMLETIREYAAELLEGSREAERLRVSHTDWFVAAAERAGPARYGGPSDVLAALASLEAESANLHAALGWARERGSRDQAGVLADALAWLWTSNGHVGLGVALAETALACQTAVEDEAETRALLASAHFEAGDGDAAYAEAKHAYELVTCLDPSPAKVFAITTFAALHRLLVDRDPALAVPLSREAVAEAEALGDRFSRIRARQSLGTSLVWSGELDEGREQHRAALDLALGSGDARAPVEIYENLLTSAYLDPEARRTEPARIAEEMLARVPLHQRGREDSSGWLAWVFLQSGEWDRAEEVLDKIAREHLEGWRQTGYLVEHAALRWMQGRLDEAQSDLDELRELRVNPRWYHDYYPLLADVAADRGRLEDVRAIADAYLAVEVDATEEAKKVAALSTLARAEADAALATSGSERAAHVERIRAAAAKGRAILQQFPPPTNGSLQMETPATYLALAQAELSRVTGPDPAPWRDAAERADYLYFRLYARWRLAEALVATGRTEEGGAELSAAHAAACKVGAGRLRSQLEALAARTGVELRREPA